MVARIPISTRHIEKASVPSIEIILAISPLSPWSFLWLSSLTDLPGQVSTHTLFHCRFQRGYQPVWCLALSVREPSWAFSIVSEPNSRQKMPVIGPYPLKACQASKEPEWSTSIDLWCKARKSTLPWTWKVKWVDSSEWVPLYATLRSFLTKISIIWERRPKFESFATTLSAKKTSRASSSSYLESTRATKAMAATPLCTQSISRLKKLQVWPKMRSVTELLPCKSQLKTLSHLSNWIKCTLICTLCCKPFPYHSRANLSLSPTCWKCS